MNALVENGLVANLVLALLALEAAALLLLWRLRGRGIAPGRLLPMLLAGAFLLLALRAALTGQGAGAIALFLALAGIAHAADLKSRWR